MEWEKSRRLKDSEVKVRCKRKGLRYETDYLGIVSCLYRSYGHASGGICFVRAAL